MLFSASLPRPVIKGKIKLSQDCRITCHSCSRCGWQRLCLTCCKSCDPRPAPGDDACTSTLQNLRSVQARPFQDVKHYLKTKPFHAWRLRAHQAAPLAPELEAGSSEIRRHIAAGSLPKPGSAEMPVLLPMLEVELAAGAVLLSFPGSHIHTATHGRNLQTQVPASSKSVAPYCPAFYRYSVQKFNCEEKKQINNSIILKETTETGILSWKTTERLCKCFLCFGFLHSVMLAHGST